MNRFEGFLLVDKPAGITSFDCIELLQDIVGKDIKIGHAGTLDAFATGLLLIAFGRSATTHMDALISLDKIYSATAQLGLKTDTLDCTGAIVQQEQSIVQQEVLEKAITHLGSSYVQVPPIFSALKYKSKRLSDLARNEKGKKLVERLAQNKAKKIDIYSLELQQCTQTHFSVLAHVSHGTYIRSLLNDIATNAGSYATTQQLRREQIGPFKVCQAQPLRGLTTVESVFSHLLPVADVQKMLTDYQKRCVAQKQLQKLAEYKQKNNAH